MELRLFIAVSVSGNLSLQISAVLSLFAKSLVKINKTRPQRIRDTRQTRFFRLFLRQNIVVQWSE